MDEENMETEDIEQLEIELDDEGIDSMIKDLQELKREKTALVIPIEDELQIVIHHSDEKEEDLEGEDE